MDKDNFPNSSDNVILVNRPQLFSQKILDLLLERMAEMAERQQHLQTQMQQLLREEEAS